MSETGKNTEIKTCECGSTFFHIWEHPLHIDPDMYECDVCKKIYDNN